MTEPASELDKAYANCFIKIIEAHAQFERDCEKVIDLKVSEFKELLAEHIADAAIKRIKG